MFASFPFPIRRSSLIHSRHLRSSFVPLIRKTSMPRQLLTQRRTRCVYLSLTCSSVQSLAKLVPASARFSLFLVLVLMPPSLAFRCPPSVHWLFLALLMRFTLLSTTLDRPSSSNSHSALVVRRLLPMPLVAATPLVPCLVVCKLFPINHRVSPVFGAIPIISAAAHTRLSVLHRTPMACLNLTASSLFSLMPSLRPKHRLQFLMPLVQAHHTQPSIPNIQHSMPLLLVQPLSQAPVVLLLNRCKAWEELSLSKSTFLMIWSELLLAREVPKSTKSVS